MSKRPPLNPSFFDGKTVLITGGTGSFGSTVAKHLLASNVKELRIFSRDEAKQHYMRFRFNDPRLKFYLGDVRDRLSVDMAMRGVDLVFHAAALKQVPNCEQFPDQAILTNALGSQNVIRSAMAEGVERMVCLSTDKAVSPVNAMGMTKALMERIVQAEAMHSYGQRHSTILSIVRYGNVLCTRGSVVPHFVTQIKNGQPITLTIPYMTRFLLTLNQSFDLVQMAFTYGQTGDLFISQAPACTVETLAAAVKQIMNVPDHPVLIAGIRPGEKIHECLATASELAESQNMGHYYKIPTIKSDMVDPTGEDLKEYEDYTSEVTRQMDVDEVAALLMSLQDFQDLL